MNQFSSKRSVQILGHILQQYGISKAIISPGSRNAPLAIHFSSLEEMDCYSIVDERSAGFVGLGMAKFLNNPVVLSCTSGSAVVNYYPAIVEAFYANIPLLVITADRPSHFVDVFDGQTIRQNNVFQQHSCGNFNLLEDDEPTADEQNFEMIKQAIELCIEKKSPVHINIPLSEPLYEYVSELPLFPEIQPKQEEKTYEIPKKLIEKWQKAEKILILTGTLSKNKELENYLKSLAENQLVVVLTEMNSNLHNAHFFPHIDRYFFNLKECDLEKFNPDLLITIGQNVVSKKVKEFLRKAKPDEHWHIDPYWQPDTYFCLTEKVNAHPEIFFCQLLKKIDLIPRKYYQFWDKKRSKLEGVHQQYCQNVDFSDFKVYDILKSEIPENYHIHFSNSSVIRYAQLFKFNESHDYHCNRGVSGIDGSTSTAMGYAMLSSRPTLLITGDLSFFYDINGLWNQYIPATTRIIIINNGGGDIFRIIPGPNSAQVVNELIATQHNRNAEDLAKSFGLDYHKVDSENGFRKILTPFFSPSERPKVLEINTSDINNAEYLKEYSKNMI
ncbi:MAG: 2-succinyl-5-enolpyruvyl-6-hydroxy-3-cyclohexene-1-carboxylic-acid synthase [Flavobacteriaceae bacterium]|nr:2-succinyl-5-enolpyruvyl-6-hydroxy-3-cyclohexene-1-carboxylic-acid synthase [Flavobacteriaceae bacterium]